ncbi:MAG: glycosyltransferase family 2 protein [Clostridiales bacterium]|nr:glycosyltransferase family 2 protein [Clostridiales bacterium]
MKRVSAIIPCRNEAKSIQETVAAVKSLPGVEEILVVDDGSKDGTARLAEEAGATVLRQPPRGKGEAVALGIRHAEGEILLLVDGDIGGTARTFGLLLDPLQEGRADMTIGVFPPTGKGGGLGLAVGLARVAVKLLTGRELRAPLSGQRALHRRILPHLRMDGGFSLEMGLNLDALWKGFRVEEVLLPESAPHAVTGKSLRGFIHRGRQLWAILKAVAVRWPMIIQVKTGRERP